MRSRTLNILEPATVNVEIEPDMNMPHRTGTESQIIVTGRNVVVPNGYLVQIAGKLRRLGKYTTGVTHYDVELYHEKNPRQSKKCQRVQIAATGNGSTVRAESRGPDFHSALDTAIHTLAQRLHRNHNKLRAHHGHHQRTSVAAATAPFATALFNDHHPSVRRAARVPRTAGSNRAGPLR
jgi:ribosomal subunit interface protein